MWDTPAGLTEEQVRALPGADEYLNTTAPPKKASGSNKVKASHLLIKHSGSRRPSSWKDAVITRSQADAVAILETHQKALRQAPDLALAFAALARTESDCSSAREGGDLGTSRRCRPRSSVVRVVWAQADAEAVRGRQLRDSGRQDERHRVHRVWSAPHPAHGVADLQCRACTSIHPMPPIRRVPIRCSPAQNRESSCVAREIFRLFFSPRSRQWFML